MKSGKISPEDFARKFVKFNLALQGEQNEKIRSGMIKIDEQEQLVELFRIWYFDSREQEMMDEARSREELDRGF
jgi:hypothetical protein